MHFAGLKISNLFSFPYISDLSSSPEVTFRNDRVANVNLLIGPNGSGKTNFLTVMYHIMKSAFLKQYVIDETHLTGPTAQYQQTIMESTQLLDRVYAHNSFSDQPSEAIVRLTLTEHDYDNIRFLLTYRIEINALITTYSAQYITFTEVDIDDVVLSSSTYTFHCHFALDTSTIEVSRDGLTSLECFVLDYLLYKELIQSCIVLHNRLDPQNFWPLLFNTVAFLDFTRSFEGLSPSFSTRSWEEYYTVVRTAAWYTSSGYFLCAKKVRDILAPHGMSLSDNTVLDILNASDFFVSLSALVLKYFSKTLSVSLQDGTLTWYLKDDEGHRYGFTDIGHGEQSLLLIIFTIYGYDLKEGMLVIDEPEMHFHPQMQRSLSTMMEKMSRNIGTQFIISTYSPLFINEENISHVYRFSKPHLCTVVKTPEVDFSGDESSLVHLLKFENLSKIFFVNRIIMVEGETDAYFFDFYFKYLHTLPEWKSVLKDYEIININGKGGYRLWKKFLARFGISSYFIGDWDNVVDYGFLNQEQLTYYYKQAKHYRPSPKQVAGGSHYNKLVLTIKHLFPQQYEAILEHIDDLYRQQVFILKKGDIESYLGLKEKGLESTVHFCHHEFASWLGDKQFDQYRNEFHEILVHIFS